MGLFNKIFRKKDLESNVQTEQQPTLSTDKLMTSQFPALYLSENDQKYRNLYLSKLMSIGFTKKNAEMRRTLKDSFRKVRALRARELREV